jgi:hypothetical protein
MLEADDQTNEMLLSAARESAARAIAERDKLQEAARLALEYLKMYQQYGPPMAFGNTTVFDAITALREALK